VFVATFRVRPPWVDFALAAAAVALIVASAARSRRLWSLAAAPAPGGAPAAWRACAAFTGLALVGLAATGFWLMPPEESWQARFLTWHFAAAAALYFPWALLQQYIFQFYWHGRWLRLVPAPFALIFTAVAFSAVHFPRWPVMLVTLGAGAFWGYCYRRWRALLPLAASHALLGAALHYWVFGRDLLALWLAR
jgi:membrane protease YdiL (CAAX protease family)